MKKEIVKKKNFNSYEEFCSELIDMAIKGNINAFTLIDKITQERTDYTPEEKRIYKKLKNKYIKNIVGGIDL